jgi:hypothetical protein
LLDVQSIQEVSEVVGVFNGKSGLNCAINFCGQAG